jgi:hypothetical protein
MPPHARVDDGQIVKLHVILLLSMVAADFTYHDHDRDRDYARNCAPVRGRDPDINPNCS